MRRGWWVAVIAQVAEDLSRVCAPRVRRHARQLGLSPSFTILDRGDSEDVMGFVRSERGLDRKERRFPRKQTLAEMLSATINRVIALDDLLVASYPHLLDEREDLERVFVDYVAYKRARQLVDYDDLLVYLRDLLVGQPAIAEQLSRQHRYIMVDEYQDTNALQAEIVHGLAIAHTNVMVVGDDAQSIYAFRGANFRNIMDFPARFPGTRVITLEENYRSTQAILDLANAVIDGARELAKNLFTRRAGERPGLVRALDELEQSRFVAQRILELREEGVPLGEMAVLFRSSFHAFDLEIEARAARHSLREARRVSLRRGGTREGCAGVPPDRRQPARRRLVAARVDASRGRWAEDGAGDRRHAVRLRAWGTLGTRAGRGATEPNAWARC